MRVTVLLLALLAPALSLAQPCSGEKYEGLVEKIVALVTRNHPVLVAEREVYTEQLQQKNWDAYVTTGYSVTNTFESGEAGPSAALRVKVPLFDRSHKLKVTTARRLLAREVNTVNRDFLTDLEQVCVQATRVAELDAMRNFYRDRLKYRQQRVEEGIDEAESLWKEAEKVQLTENEWLSVRSKLTAMQLTMAREYGGTNWNRLRAILVEITKSNRP
mgnify:CR=1 FL=1